MDDTCLSPELDGASEMPLLNTGEHRHFWEERHQENVPTMNSSWEQNASA
jgi:hypothetical protein